MKKICEYVALGIVVISVVVAAYVGGWVFFIDGATNLLRMLHGILPATRFNVLIAVVKMVMAGVVVLGIVALGLQIGDTVRKVCKRIKCKGVKNG